MKNAEIREAARKKGVKLWEVAAELGITAETFSKKLRFEFSDDEREKALAAIDKVFASR